jgi:hypothetical protein
MRAAAELPGPQFVKDTWLITSTRLTMLTSWNQREFLPRRPKRTPAFWLKWSRAACPQRRIQKNLRSELSYRISTLEITLRAEIKELETTLRAEIRELEIRLNARIDELEAKMNERFRWQWWANGVMVALLIGLYFR